MLPRRFLDFRLSEMVSDAIFKQKKSLLISNQNNVELSLKISYCKRNLSRQFPKDPKASVTCVPHIYTSLLLVILAQPRDGAAGVITYKPPQQR